MLIFLIFTFICVCQCVDYRVVDTSEGPVKGYKDGGIYGFYNIPYAKAPTGRDRFKPALPAPQRTYLLEAVDKGIVCPQPKDLWVLLNRSFLMTEDCLIVNIFTPDTTKTNLPVLVSVHGGGFVIGDGNLLRYKNLIKDRELIVVTFNYRLGAHGFLCLGTDDAPGNSGMKDQVALLRWVKANIAKFGGNPDDVTITGGSAGAASVHLLMLSPMSQGLFNKVIPESGAATAPWAVQIDPIWVAQEYAKMLNFSNYQDLNALEEFYKTVSYEILASEAMQLMNQAHASISLGPCLEKGSGDKFLTESPVNILKSGKYSKVPMLFGFAKMEGLIRKDVFDDWSERMNAKFSDFIPLDLDLDNETIQKVKEFYFGTSPIDKTKIVDYINYFTDIVIAYPTLRSLKMHIDADQDNIYLYEFSFVHDDLPYIPYTHIRGADHCAQTLHVGDGNLTHTDDGVLPEECREMKRKTRELWYNFITEGKPVPEGSAFPSWPPVGKDLSPHMVIDDPLLVLKDVLNKERMVFWDDIYEKNYRHPSPSKIKLSTRTEL